MNRLTLLAATATFVAAVQLHAQTPSALDDFIGIRWGSNAATVKSTMKEYGSTFNAKLSRDKVLLFKGGTFVGEKMEMAGCYVGAQGFFGISTMLKPKSDAKVIPTYRALRDTLIAKFGAPSNEEFSFEAPYREGDGREVEAIRNRKGSCYAHWSFTNASGQENDIILKIEGWGKDISITLNCTNSTLQD